MDLTSWWDAYPEFDKPRPEYHFDVLYSEMTMNLNAYYYNARRRTDFDFATNLNKDILAKLSLEELMIYNNHVETIQKKLKQHLRKYMDNLEVSPEIVRLII